MSKGIGQGFNLQNSFLKAEKPFADDNEPLSKAPREVQTVILDIYEIAKKYESTNKISEHESFKKSLEQLNETVHSTLLEKTYSIAEEIDYGTSYIHVYQIPLNFYQSIYNESSNSANSAKIKFFTKYYENLVHQYNSLNLSIKNFESDFGSRMNSSNQENGDILLMVLRQQNEAIIRCSSRLCSIRERSKQLENRIKALHRDLFNHFEEFSDDRDQKTHQSSGSVKLRLQESLKKNEQTKVMNLEKRNTNRELFRPKKAATSSLFGTGINFNKPPKANFGANTQTTTSFKITNQSSRNQITSTPTSLKSGGGGDFTPVKHAATGEAYSGANNSGKYTPTAPKKGGRQVNLLDSPTRS